jgi:hypothetical protein
MGVVQVNTGEAASKLAIRPNLLASARNEQNATNSCFCWPHPVVVSK